MNAELARLTASIRACRICRDSPLGRPLPHEPRPVVVPSSTARILIAGQAPGTRVHASGMPFDDRSGDRLRDWMGVDRETFYDAGRIAIVPMGFCFPGLDAKGGDLPPRRECAPAWRRPLLELMPQVDLVLAIGLYAQRWHLGPSAGTGLTVNVQGWRAIFERPGGRRILPLPHPSWRNTAWLKRNPWFEAELLPVLRGEIAQRL
ncbi:MAG: uracil-DNA glycosylase family protein [Rhizobiaceae bacterium]|nr:uracil-DNA glycosylase family protein [Rhizobiaceae bacterium]